MMPGTRLLAFASRWFEPAVVASVFEPLVADWQGEARASHLSFWINLRWRLAFLANCVLAFPRLGAVPASSGLLLDLVARAVVFGALGFALQQMFGRREAIEGTAVIDSLPFALLPVVMRLQRSTELPSYATRGLALRWTLATAIALALFSGPSWQSRGAAAAIPIVIALFGWRLGANRQQWTNYRPIFQWWLTIAMLASIWALAVYPLKYALGIPLMGRFWDPDLRLLLAVLLSSLIQADEWRERRGRLR
jgi:hypothetical protein